MTLFVILGGLFLLGLVLWIFYGYGIVMKSPVPGSAQQLQQCGLCQKKFSRSEMVERQIGDSKLLYFCETCVEKLNKDLTITQQRS